MFSYNTWQQREVKGIVNSVGSVFIKIFQLFSESRYFVNSILECLHRTHLWEKHTCSLYKTKFSVQNQDFSGRAVQSVQWTFNYVWKYAEVFGWQYKNRELGSHLMTESYQEWRSSHSHYKLSVNFNSQRTTSSSQLKGDSLKSVQTHHVPRWCRKGTNFSSSRRLFNLKTMIWVEWKNRVKASCELERAAWKGAGSIYNSIFQKRSEYIVAEMVVYRALGKEEENEINWFIHQPI